MEFGRFLVGEAGVYVTRVVDRKESRGSTYLVVDGGLHHQLAASGNFGQVLRRNYPLVIGSRMDAEPTETVQVVGALCTPLDLLGDRVSVPPCDVGRPRRHLPGRRLRTDRQPHGLLGPSRSSGGTRMSQTVTEVAGIVATVLGIEDRADDLTEDTPLLGAMPELDSLAVVELITALSERYGFDPDDVDLSGDAFDTIGTLATFVEDNAA